MKDGTELQHRTAINAMKDAAELQHRTGRTWSRCNLWLQGTQHALPPHSYSLQTCSAPSR
eukprot:1156564-Pelagomonas_calceolata.AAC.5